MKRIKVLSSGTRRAQLLSLHESSSATGMHPELILEFVQADYVRAAGVDAGGEPYFDESGLLRLRTIEEMRERWGVSLRALRHIVSLLDRLDAAEQELRLLRERLR